MNEQDACRILECTLEIGMDKEQLKRQYRKMCLKYHPDKNPDPSAQSYFHQILSAYEYLYAELENDDIFLSEPKENTTTETISEKYIFLWNWIVQYTTDAFLPKIMQGMDRMDKDTLLEIYEWLCKKRQDMTEYSLDENLERDVDRRSGKFRRTRNVVGNVVETSDSKTDLILKHMRSLLQSSLKKRIQHDRFVILYPSLKDVFAANVYCHVENEHSYMIPTWMEESIFDLLPETDSSSSTMCELIVQCIPQCPEGVYIDSKHHVHKQVTLDLRELWDQDDSYEISTEIVGNLFTFIKGDLFLRKQQTMVIPRRGIPCGNPQDIFDVSKRGNIVLHIAIKT